MKQLRRVKFLFFLLIPLLLNSCRIYDPEYPQGEIVVYGDTRSNHDIHREVVDAILVLKPRATFHTGDLVNNGRLQSEWDIFNDISAPLLVITNFYAAIGNHEYNSDLYYQNFEFPGNERWYSVNVKKVHFIILDSNYGIEIGSPQYEWLHSDLIRTTRRNALIAVIFHHPPYSTGPHREDEKGLRSTVVPLFEKYGVDIVFNGHDHCYERSMVNGIYYIVTGGGGAPLYDQARMREWSQVYIKEHHFTSLQIHRRRIIIDVYDRDLNVLDHFIVRDSAPQPFLDEEQDPVHRNLSH